MRIFSACVDRESGFSFTELLAVISGIVIIAGIGLPVVTTVTDSYSLVLGAQQIVTQLQAARMKAVTNNETIRVHFFPNANFYQIETNDGLLLSGPYFLAPGLMYNAGDTGSAVSLNLNIAAFQPNGNLPGAGGRVKIINRSQTRIDILINSSGMVQSTPAFRSSAPPF